MMTAIFFIANRSSRKPVVLDIWSTSFATFWYIANKIHKIFALFANQKNGE